MWIVNVLMALVVLNLFLSMLSSTPPGSVRRSNGG